MICKIKDIIYEDFSERISKYEYNKDNQHLAIATIIDPRLKNFFKDKKFIKKILNEKISLFEGRNDINLDKRNSDSMIGLIEYSNDI